MSYKDVLVKRVEDAQKWVEDNQYTEAKDATKDELHNISISAVDIEIFEDCKFIDTFESICADPVLAEYIIDCDNDNRLFSSLRLDDESQKAYEQSVMRLKSHVSLVQKASYETINVRVPLRPKDNIYEVVNYMKSNGYSEDNMKQVLYDINPYAERPPKMADVIEEREKEFITSIEEVIV